MLAASWGAPLGGAAVALLVVFLGALRATLRRREGEAGPFSAVAVIAGSVVAAGGAVAVALGTVDGTGDAETADALAIVLALPTATLLGAAAAGILTTRALHPAVAYAAVAVAALHLLAAVSVADDGPLSPGGVVPDVALAAFASWVALAAAAMISRRGD